LVLLENVVHDVKLAAHHGQVVAVPRAHTKRPPMVAADHRWLAIAFRNIIDNAIKFGKSSPVTINVREVREDDDCMETQSLQAFALVSIRDHGIGIPENEQLAIFRPGHQNSYSRKFNVTGSQIALAVTKEIIEDHAGSIWVRSTKGHGATFVVKLPILP
jgi:signal transduction histidine kinase